MFEQSMMNGPRARPWTFSVSTAMQVFVVGVAVLVPLLKVEALPPVKLCDYCMPPHTFRIVMVQPAGGSPVRPGALTTTAIPRVRGVFTAPSAIPHGVPQLFGDDPGLTFAGTVGSPIGTEIGVPGGWGSPTESLTRVAPPPAPPPPSRPAPVAAKEPIVAFRGGRVEPPLLIHEVRPPYPPLARQARISGTVKMEAILARDGTVQSLRTVSGHPLLVQAAMNAVSQWRYRPTLLNGQPVEILLSVDVNFTLTQ